MFAQVGSELSTRVLRSAVGMKHRTRSKLDLGRGHGDRVTDQIGFTPGKVNAVVAGLGDLVGSQRTVTFA